MVETQPPAKGPGRRKKASAATHADPRYQIALDPSFTAEGIVGGEPSALAESEQRYRALVELSPFAIAVHGGGRLLYVNPACLTLMRAKDPSELLGRPVMDFVHPDSREGVRRRIANLYNKKGPAPLMEERLVRDDGTAFEVEAAAALITYRGEPAVQVLFQDISQRKEAERALQERERRYRTLVDSAFEGVWSIDAETRTDYVNQRMADLLGYRPEEMLGRPLDDFIFERDRTRVDDNLERRKRGIREQQEMMLRRKDGSPIWLLMVTNPLYDAQGHYTGALAMATDLTEYKQAQAQIQTQQTELENLVEQLSARHAQTEAEVAQRTRELQAEKLFIERIINNAPMAILYLDRDYHVRWFNPEFVHLVGRDSPALLDRPVFEVWPGVQAQFKDLLDRLFKSGEVTRLTAVHYVEPLPSGEEKITYWDLTLVPVLDQEGYVDGIVAITIDATSRVEAEQAHLQQIETLRQMDRLKDNFINTVTHELRTPLTAIMGYCEFLEDHIGGELTEDQEEFVRQIKEGGERLKRLVDDLLDFARLEAGAFKLTVRESDLAELVREEVEALMPKAENVGQEVKVELPEDLIAILDPDRIGQVVRNLVGNAIKFTPSGGRIWVRVRAEGDHVRVEVEDDGPGIDPELHPRVFEKFFQADPSLTRLHGDAGLGLAISKALVEAHDGHIGFDSCPGNGSMFWFTLPFDDGQNAVRA